MNQELTCFVANPDLMHNPAIQTLTKNYTLVLSLGELKTVTIELPSHLSHAELSAAQIDYNPHHLSLLQASISLDDTHTILTLTLRARELGATVIRVYKPRSVSHPAKIDTRFPSQHVRVSSPITMLYRLRQASLFA
jgi:hypothetical protein